MDSLIALENIKRQPKAKYAVLVYFLTDDEIIAAQQVYGGIIVMGTYANKELAVAAAQKIIDDTDHRQVMILKTCEWHFLKPEAYRDSEVVPATRDLLFETESRMSAELDLKKHKAETIARDEIAEHAVKARNPDCVENYRYRISQVLDLKKQLAKTQARIDELQAKIRDQLEAHPEFI